MHTSQVVRQENTASAQATALLALNRVSGTHTALPVSTIVELHRQELNTSNMIVRTCVCAFGGFLLSYLLVPACVVPPNCRSVQTPGASTSDLYALGVASCVGLHRGRALLVYWRHLGGVCEGMQPTCVLVHGS